MTKRDTELIDLGRKLRSCSTDVLELLHGSFDHGARPEAEIVRMVEGLLIERRRLKEAHGRELDRLDPLGKARVFADADNNGRDAHVIERSDAS